MVVFVVPIVSKGRKDGGREGKEESIGHKERKRILTWTKSCVSRKGVEVEEGRCEGECAFGPRSLVWEGCSVSNCNSYWDPLDCRSK